MIKTYVLGKSTLGEFLENGFKLDSDVEISDDASVKANKYLSGIHLTHGELPNKLEIQIFNPYERSLNIKECFVISIDYYMPRSSSDLHAPISVHGITIGSTIDEVRKAFGIPYEETYSKDNSFTTFWYKTEDYKRIDLDFSNDKVNSIGMHISALSSDYDDPQEISTKSWKEITENNQ